MSTKVMVHCPTGAYRLNDAATDRAWWEAKMWTITWAHYDTPEEAAHVAAELNAGASRGTRAWAESDEWS